MSDEIEQELKEIIDGTNKDLSWARGKYEETYAKYSDKASSTVTDEDLKNWALKAVRSEISRTQNMGIRDVEELEIISIGHSGVQEWRDGDGGKKDVLLSYGVVVPEDEPAGVGVFINDATTGVDIGDVREKFTTFNVLKGWYSIEEADDLENTYVCNSGSETKVVEDGTDKSEDELRGFVDQFVDEASLQDIVNHISKQNKDGYPAAFGGDIKKINGTIVNTTAKSISILDDTVIDVDDMDERLKGDGEYRDLGMLAWTPEDFNQYGEDSVCNFYGSIGVQDSGRIVLNVYGIDPVIPMEKTVDEEDDDVEEETI